MVIVQDSPRLCECGCGHPAPIALCSCRSRGQVKGQPFRFIRGHGRWANMPPSEVRFWSHVDTSGGIFACWPWTGIRNNTGYGLFDPGRTRRVLAHRYAYELRHGPIPPW